MVCLPLGLGHPSRVGCGGGWLGGLGCLQAREKENAVAAPFLMVEKVTPDKAVEAMSKYGGTVLKTSLSKDCLLYTSPSPRD